MKKTVATMLLGMLFAGSALASDTVQWESKTIEYNGPKFTCDTSVNDETIAQITYNSEDVDLRQITSDIAPGAEFGISPWVKEEKNGQVLSTRLPLSDSRYDGLFETTYINHSTTFLAKTVTNLEHAIGNGTPLVEKYVFEFGFKFTEVEPVDSDIKYTVVVDVLCDQLESDQLPEFLK